MRRVDGSPSLTGEPCHDSRAFTGDVSLGDDRQHGPSFNIFFSNFCVFISSASSIVRWLLFSEVRQELTLQNHMVLVTEVCVV
ncbi:unnamed protein product [Victoria cruziana]